MAEAAQGPPTFKLVLVGDGGTGKVSSEPIPGLGHRSLLSQLDLLTDSLLRQPSSSAISQENLRRNTLPLLVLRFIHWASRL